MESTQLGDKEFHQKLEEVGAVQNSDDEVKQFGVVPTESADAAMQGSGWPSPVAKGLQETPGCPQPSHRKLSA
ncbi:unnamed protein product [Symbiodinium sp. CCMP2592]|nr:unnamed protein product [Symbiodinium sp. CCMP2592]